MWRCLFYLSLGIGLIRCENSADKSSGKDSPPTHKESFSGPSKTPNESSNPSKKIMFPEFLWLPGFEIKEMASINNGYGSSSTLEGGLDIPGISMFYHNLLEENNWPLLEESVTDSAAHIRSGKNLSSLIINIKPLGLGSQIHILYGNLNY